MVTYSALLWVLLRKRVSNKAEASLQTAVQAWLLLRFILVDGTWSPKGRDLY